MAVYLDYNATTPPHPSLLAEIPGWLQVWGNPSSVHAFGRDPKRILREARERVAAFLDVDPLEIIFTSGGTESNFLALHGAYAAVRAAQPLRRRIVISSVEHPAVTEVAYHLKDAGAEICKIPVNREGFIDLIEAERLINSDTALVSVMRANNETGNIFPIEKLAKIAHAQGALLHSDCVQALGKIPINLRALDVDYASFSAHKFYALRGCGVLYQKRGSPLSPQLRGGGHERRRRAGTENLLAIAALGFMCARPTEELTALQRRMGELRDQFEAAVLLRIPGAQINGQGAPRVSNTSNITLPLVAGDTLLMGLDMRGFAVSTGSACSSGAAEPSPVLRSMGLSFAEADRSLRVSLGWQTTSEDIEAFIAALIEVCQRVSTLQSTTQNAYGDVNGI